MTNVEQDIKIAQTKQEVDDFKSIIENFIGEMRDRDNQRAAENRALRERHEADMKEFQKKHEADMKEFQKKHDTDMKELRTEIREATKDIRALTIAAVVGIVAIAVSVIGFVFVVWQSMDQKIDQKLNYPPPQFQTQNFVQPQTQNNSPQN